MTEQQLASLRVETARAFMRNLRFHGLDADRSCDQLLKHLNEFIVEQMRVAVRPEGQEKTPGRETRG